MSEIEHGAAFKPLSAFELRRRGGVRVWLRERALTAGLLACAGFSVLVTAAIVVVLFSEAARFFAMPEVSVWGYLTGTEWNPLLGGEKKFGMWPLVTGTLMVALISALVSIPLGLVTAIYLSEYAPSRVRAVLKPVLEVLAGIPTVVYGFFALTIISPYFLIEPARFVTGLLEGEPRDVFGFTNSTAAGIAVGIMCLPTVTSLSEDALRAVPRALREGAYGLGATRFDVSVKVVVPSALSGVIAAFILAIARAVGETMIVALAAGGLAQMAFGPAPAEPTFSVQIELDGGGAAGVRLDPNEIVWLAPMLAPGDDPGGAERTFGATMELREGARTLSVELDAEGAWSALDSLDDAGLVEAAAGSGVSSEIVDRESGGSTRGAESTDAVASAVRVGFEIPLGAFVDAETGEPIDAGELRDGLPLGGDSEMTLIYDADDGLLENFVFRPESSSQTMTAYMVQIFLGDAEFASVEYHSSYAVGATLFVMTLVLTMLGNVVMRRYREAYD